MLYLKAVKLCLVIILSELTERKADVNPMENGLLFLTCVMDMKISL
jgi:hypothetical protein